MMNGDEGDDNDDYDEEMSYGKGKGGCQGKEKGKRMR